MRGFIKYLYFYEGRLVPFSRLPGMFYINRVQYRTARLQRRQDRVLAEGRQLVDGIQEQRRLSSSSSSSNFGSQLQPDEDDNINGNIDDHADDNEEEENLECVICLKAMKDDEVVIKELLCHHRFHSLCIAEWLKRRSNCPICRRSSC